jgi:hypothetical protein
VSRITIHLSAWSTKYEFYKTKFHT